MYRVAAYSNVGLRKKTNQDSCYAEVAVTPYGDTAIIAVCDGVGGLSSGELASGSAVEWLAKWFETSYAGMLEQQHDDVEALFNHVQSNWENGLIGLNAALRSYGREHDTSLGTTFTAILFFNGRYIIGHVGDTRVYCFDDSGMNILTDDQTWVARELALGNITAAQARSHPKKNVILQSVGTQRELLPVFSRGTGGNPGQTYMVCCDGFRNELFDDELQQAFGSLKNADPSEAYKACEDLANLAMQRNEKDNISAVVLICAEGSDYDIPDQAVFRSDEADAPSMIEPFEAADVTTNLMPDEPTADQGDAVAKDEATDSPEDDATTVLDGDDSATTVLAGGDDMTTVLGDDEGVTTVLTQDEDETRVGD